MSFFVGAISGTSIDGLDVALIEVAEERVRLIQGKTFQFPNSLATRLGRLANPNPNEIQALGRAHAALGTFIGRTIGLFLDETGIRSNDVTAVGSHGQTVRHFPSGVEAFSLQIGDASRIAEVTGIDTVADFRSRDIAAGGEGAPLVPDFHRRLFHSTASDRVVLNIGGIANVTTLPAREPDICAGFDTGPGNGLIDAYMQKKFSQRYDRNGSIASSGQIHPALLAQLMSDEWLQHQPPKSTGKEHFNYEYVQNAIRAAVVQLDDADVLATLTELTVLSIRDAIAKWCFRSGELVVCGGGRLNAYLMQRLAKSCPSFHVMPCESLDVDGDSVEAAAFAYLAYLHVNGKTGNVPQVTGAKGARVLGCLYPA